MLSKHLRSLCGDPVGRCLAMGWGSVITGGGWGAGAVQGREGEEAKGTNWLLQQNWMWQCTARALHFVYSPIQYMHIRMYTMRQRHTDMQWRQCAHPPPQMWLTSKWKCLHHFPPKFLHSRVAISCNGNFAVFPQSVYSGVLLQVLKQEVLCILLICIFNSCCSIWWNDSFVLQLQQTQLGIDNVQKCYGIYL